MTMRSFFRSIRRKREPRVTETFDSSFYRRVSARHNVARVTNGSGFWCIRTRYRHPTNPTRDATVELGGVVRDPRLMDEKRPTELLGRVGDHPRKLDLIRGNPLRSFGEPSEAVATSGRGDADQRGLPGARSTDGGLLQPPGVVGERMINLGYLYDDVGVTRSLRLVEKE